MPDRHWWLKDRAGGGMLSLIEGVGAGPESEFINALTILRHACI